MNYIGDEEVRELYYYLTLTRRFDERINELYKQGGMYEKPISVIGQEATAVGATLALEERDYVGPSLRTRGAFLAKGVTPEEILTEVYRKWDSKSGGRFSAHHMGHHDRRVLLGSYIVGSSVPVAAGVALASKIRGLDEVVLVFYGDGGSSRGDVHEALNIAAVLDLPVIFLCENNLWAVSTPANIQMKNQDVADRAFGYGIPGEIVDGQDIIEVYLATQRAVRRARRGDGPTLIECKTYHFRGHSESHDPDDGRPSEELDVWRSRDPLAIYKQYLQAEHRMTDEEMEEIDVAIDAYLDDSVTKVEAKEEVAPTVEAVTKHLYS